MDHALADAEKKWQRSRQWLAVLSVIAALVLWASMSLAQTPDSGYRVFRPDGAGPHPAVAFVSGCSGFAPVGARKF